ncbi:MAG: hypothetical protein FWH22_06500 [Fibromonadales bacterium]|nr:hypothetical protein [Fibromonadales bacterium]
MFTKMFAVSLNKFEINKGAEKFLEISGAPSWIDIIGKIKGSGRHFERSNF